MRKMTLVLSLLGIGMLQACGGQDLGGQPSGVETSLGVDEDAACPNPWDYCGSIGGYFMGSPYLAVEGCGCSEGA